MSNVLSFLHFQDLRKQAINPLTPNLYTFMKTTHKLLFQDARDLKEIPSESVDLVVTSPPYPMIEMWDEMFSHQNPYIQDALACGDGMQAYALMHEILDAVWHEVFRVLKNGRFACINIGDATRTVKSNFCLYSNEPRENLDVSFKYRVFSTPRYPLAKTGKYA